MSPDEFRQLADNIPTLAWMAGADGYIHWYNRRWHEYCGTTPEQMEGWGWQTVHDPAALPAVLERWQASIATGAPFDMTFPLRGADGVYRPFLTRVQPGRGPPEAGHPDGRVTGCFGMNTDISAQVAAETALRVERDRNKSVLDSMAEGLVLLDPDFRILSVNAEAARLDTRAAGALVGLTHWEAYPGTEDSDLGRLYKRAMAERTAVAAEHRYAWEDGRTAWLDMRAYPVPEGLAVFFRDVTSRKHAEERLRESEGQLRELNETLERRVEKAVSERGAVENALRQAQKMEAVGQLTGGLAHDFNNLLTGIAGSLELLQARLAQGRLKDLDRYVNAAQGAARRAAALTHRLLAFSRQQTLEPKPTDVNRMVAGMQDLLERTMGPEISIEPVAGVGLWATLVDTSQLENALLNLCINARDAMPHGGRLSIETANRWLDGRASGERDMPAGQYVSLCVSDNGTGMPPDVAARAFDPFFTTKPIGQGTGLGLSMIYGFARQSGGQARIYSEVGQGTTVCLYLPRHLGQAETAELPAEPACAPRATQGETVLVVDDEPTVRMLVTDLLEDFGDNAIEAADGAAGLKILESDIRIDLLVTDVGLPGGMNGRQLADAARGRRPALKVLFITGYAENAVLSHGHLDAGTQVMTKPFAMEALAGRIRGMIAERRPG